MWRRVFKSTQRTIVLKRNCNSFFWRKPCKVSKRYIYINKQNRVLNSTINKTDCAIIPLENSVASAKTVKHGSKVTFSCRKGFESADNLEFTCENGVVDTGNSRCLRELISFKIWLNLVYFLKFGFCRCELKIMFAVNKFNIIE